MLRPSVKREHVPLILPDGRIRLGLGQYGVATEIDDEDGAVERLLGLLDGSRDVEAICTELAATHADWDAESVAAAIDQLGQAGHLEDLGAPLPAGLTADDVARYRSNQAFWSWIDPTPRPSPYDVLARIRRSRVVLLGLGGTGSAVAASLVASGVGALHCVDHDRVETTNLTRQLLYTQDDVGRTKVAAAVARLRSLNPTACVTGEELRVRGPGDVERLMAGADAFVLCADEPADVIQPWTNDAALRTGTPWFFSAYTGAMTGVATFVPRQTGCWECARRRERQLAPHQGGRWLFDHRPQAVVAPSAAICGHLAALEVLYHLGGLPSQARGRVFQLNLARWDHHDILDVPRDPSCPACGDR